MIKSNFNIYNINNQLYTQCFPTIVNFNLSFTSEFLDTNPQMAVITSGFCYNNVNIAFLLNSSFKTFIVLRSAVIDKVDSRFYSTSHSNYIKPKLSIANILIKDIYNGDDYDKFSMLNSYIFKTLDTRHHEIYIPLFIPISLQPFTPHPKLTEEIKLITLPSQKVLQAPHIHRAIMGVTNSWDSKTKAKAFSNTDGSLGLIEQLD